ncbi:MAG TPA: hypothetical protein VMB82_06710 [Acidimicrobiales bacterium]|nr:hypothetical protein [Acidimicrobiales bacterium]
MGGNLRPWRSTTLRPGTTGTAETGRDERSRKRRFLFALLGAFFAFTGSFAVATWVLGLSAGSTGQAVSTGSSDLSIAAVASPSPGNLLYPGASGDVVVAISNPNPYPVTITAIQLPADTADADGYSDSGLTTLQAGCSSSTPSGVTWSFATASSGSSHTLTTPLTVAAGGQTGNPLVVTLTDAATMSLSSPTACEDTYFAMPSLAGVTAGAGTGPATSSPTTDGWTS